jgi:hypothetical protein
MKAESRLATATFWLAAAVAFVYVSLGVLHPALGDWNSSTDRIIFLVVVAGGGLLVTAGLVVFKTKPTQAAVLIGIGSVLGAVGLVWTLVLPVIAVVLVVLTARRARTLAHARPAVAAG